MRTETRSTVAFWFLALLLIGSVGNLIAAFAHAWRLWILADGRLADVVFFGVCLLVAIPAGAFLVHYFVTVSNDLRDQKRADSTQV